MDASEGGNYNGGKLRATKEEPIGNFMNFGDSPQYTQGRDFKRRIECIIGISRTLEHMRINNLQLSILRVSKHCIFPRLEGHNPPVEKKWAIVSTVAFRPRPTTQ